MDEVTSEDLAFPPCFSRGPDRVGRRGLSERSEFRSRREGQGGNGVKNLTETKPFSKTYFCHGKRCLFFLTLTF